MPTARTTATTATTVQHTQTHTHTRHCMTFSVRNPTRQPSTITRIVRGVDITSRMSKRSGVGESECVRACVRGKMRCRDARSPAAKHTRCRVRWACARKHGRGGGDAHHRVPCNTPQISDLTDDVTRSKHTSTITHAQTHTLTTSGHRRRFRRCVCV